MYWNWQLKGNDVLQLEIECVHRCTVPAPLWLLQLSTTTLDGLAVRLSLARLSMYFWCGLSWVFALTGHQIGVACFQTLHVQ